MALQPPVYRLDKETGQITPDNFEVAVVKLLGYYEDETILRDALQKGMLHQTPYAYYCTNRAALTDPDTPDAPTVGQVVELSDGSAVLLRDLGDIIREAEESAGEPQ